MMTDACQQTNNNNNYNNNNLNDNRTPQVTVQIVSVEWTLENPISGLDVQWSRFTASPVKRVPVLHIYGCEPTTGQKICVHLHNALPYFFVALPDTVPLEPAAVYRYMHQLQVNIDHAVTLAQRGESRTYTTPPTTTSSHSTTPNDPHVFALLLVRGKPFYGFAITERLFLKIFMYPLLNTFTTHPSSVFFCLLLELLDC